MTKLMELAWERLSQLPEERQDEVAILLLDELDEDEVWMKSIAARPELLERLGEQALEEYRAGLTRPLTAADFDLPDD